MAEILSPTSGLFPDTKVGDSSEIKIKCYQDKLFPTNHDYELDAAKPFLMKPYGESAYALTFSNEALSLRNYIYSLCKGTPYYNRVADVVNTENFVYGAISYRSIRTDKYLGIEKISKSSYARTQLEFIDTRTDVIVHDFNKIILPYGDNFVAAYIFEDALGFNLIVKQFDADLTVSATLSDIDAAYDFEIKDLKISSGKLFIIGYKTSASDGILIVVDLATSAILATETVTGYLPETLAIKQEASFDSDILLIGCDSMILTAFCVISDSDFAILSKSIPNADGDDCVAIEDGRTGIVGNYFYSVTSDTVAPFNPLGCLKSDTGAEKNVFIIGGPTSYTLTDLAFEMVFIPENDTDEKTLIDDSNNIRIKITAANALLIECYTDAGWATMVTSAVLPVKAFDVAKVNVTRVSDEWTIEFNDISYVVTYDVGYDTIVTVYENSVFVLGSDFDPIFIRSVSLENATSTLFDFVFNLSSSGFYSSGEFVVSGASRAGTAPRQSYAMFRRYEYEITLDPHVIGAKYSNKNMYFIRDNGSRAASISKLSMPDGLSGSDSEAIISSDSTEAAATDFRKIIDISEADEMIYFCANCGSGYVFEKTATIGKIGLDLSYKINKRYCEFKFTPTEAGIFKDNWVIDSVTGMPLLGIGYTQADRVVPYGTILMGEGVKDYARLGDSGSVNVDTYVRISPWETFAGRRYAYSLATQTFTADTDGTYKKVSYQTLIQDESEDFEAYFDTVNYYFNKTNPIIKSNPISLFLVSAVSVIANDIMVTLDSNYRFDENAIEIKMNGYEEESSSFENDTVYALGSKQIEVDKVECINSRPGNAVKFRIRARLNNPRISAGTIEVYGPWRIFELKYTPSNLFYTEGKNSG